VAIVRQRASEPRRELAFVRWGLVPYWAKDIKIGSRMINARSETVATKPAFRAALGRRRCLILADGYYEWQKVGRKKERYHFHLADGRPFALAGLWENWRGPNKDSNLPGLETCTIITTDANPQVRAIHDRMPLILDPADYDSWLDPSVTDTEAIVPMLQPMAEPLVIDSSPDMKKPTGGAQVAELF
jgi:putative SOS response-associated peptidase YedK